MSKLVDADFLAKLVAGSYETTVGAVDEAVQRAAGQFGGDADSISTLATYPDHIIVANGKGEFFRAKWSVVEDRVEVSEVEDITKDVPVYESGTMGAQVREEAAEAVRLMLADNDEEADVKLSSLYGLVKRGVRLTAEGVEDLFIKQDFTEDDWFKAAKDNGNEIRAFLGADAMRLDVPKPAFGAVLSDGLGESEAEKHRPAVASGVKGLRDLFIKMQDSIALAKQVNEGYGVRGGDQAGGLGVTDFVEFVEGLSDALEGMIAILEDGVAVSEDGCVKCLARLHNGVAGQAYEWALASAFAEKLARRFEPVAA